MNDKICAVHLERRAVVYLRQSTLRQVAENRESTARQYDLRRRALELGWPADRIVVIDEDLGTSGTGTSVRSGFERLADDVAHGRVGVVLALEASRLARRSADWHRLLDLCRLADVVIADDQSVFAPRDYNDQLLLGLKGTMAEAESVWLRRRLNGGRLSKARRGELFMPPPTGYVWDEAVRRFRLDPDETVQRAVTQVFERFRVEGTARGVVRYFHQSGLQLPVRDRVGGPTKWVPINPTTVSQMLHNPTYAGAYVYGRTEERAGLVGGQLKRRCVKRIPREAWEVCLRDHHPAYLEWDEFLDNGRKLQDNSNKTQGATRSAPREGTCLLQGLVLCGRCGRRMTVRYSGADDGAGSYVCAGPAYRTGENRGCWSVRAARIDELVAALFLEVVQPAGVELGLAVARRAEQEADDLDKQWRLRLEQVEYQASLAERRYKQVDPDNRVVARTLERDWEERLRDVEARQIEYAEARRRARVDLGDADRKQILALSLDLPQVWKSATTTPAQRKTLIRLVIRQVALATVDVPAGSVRIQVCWETGAVTERFVAHRGPAWCATPDRARERIRELCEEGDDDSAIARKLDEAGFRTGRGRAWDRAAVARVRVELGLRRSKHPVDQRPDGTYSARGVAARFGVTVETVHRWAELGWLEVHDPGGRGRPAWYRLDDATLERIACGRSRRSSGARPPTNTE